jgi:hypothetical protein
MLGTQ